MYCLRRDFHLFLYRIRPLSQRINTPDWYFNKLEKNKLVSASKNLRTNWSIYRTKNGDPAAEVIVYRVKDSEYLERLPFPFDKKDETAELSAQCEVRGLEMGPGSGLTGGGSGLSPFPILLLGCV